MTLADIAPVMKEIMGAEEDFLVLSNFQYSSFTPGVANIKCTPVQYAGFVVSCIYVCAQNMQGIFVLAIYIEFSGIRIWGTGGLLGPCGGSVCIPVIHIPPVLATQVCGSVKIVGCRGQNYVDIQIQTRVLLIPFWITVTTPRFYL